MATELTLSKVMSRLESRLNPILNQNHPRKPDVPMKNSSAMITREEFEVLSKEIEDLIFFQETKLLQEDFLETVYGGQDD